jgi:hypothetical protein
MILSKICHRPHFSVGVISVVQYPIAAGGSGQPVQGIVAVALSACGILVVGDGADVVGVVQGVTAVQHAVAALIL